MKNILLLFLFTVLLLSKSVQDSTKPITFHGNKYVKRSALEEVVGAHRPSPFAIWKEDIATIDSILRPKLNETFRLFYRNEGFYDANISHYIDTEGIHVVIKENRPIVIDSILIESDLDIKEEITLKKNTRFRAENFGITKKNIRKRLLSEGYCSPNLNTKAYIDLEKYTASIEIKLEKRKVCHFGDISIESSSATMSDDIILSRLNFEEGDVFDLNKIKESYDALYALEAFDQLHLDYSLNLYNKKPIKIKFKEIQKHIHTRMGIGYATDLKFQAKYHWEYKNFYGNGKKLIFDGLLSEKQKILENSFFFPYVVSIFDYHLDFENSVGYSEEQNLHDYDEKVVYERLYLSHSSSRWYNSIGLGIENREISNDQTFFLIYPFMKIVYDRRDSKLNPTEGIYFSHEMEYGLPYSPDSTTYLKYLEELRAMYTLSDVTLSAVGRIGAIKVFKNDMPESKKFFAGGAFSNRAYGYDQIGITKSATEDLINGGYTLANLSLEANFPIYKDFGGAIFSDNTMISENQGLWEFSNNVIYSAGLGLRYLTPIGPFKIDMGFNIKNKSENAIHFQVGQSF
ncbi:BamA/TamA family outer membrane protein [bacterium]|nr:BamA/TamA family outer membrane protein [bacterium]MBU1957508.1 BamA/TamA family outer membrane protein [bacterium]